MLVPLNHLQSRFSEQKLINERFKEYSYDCGFKAILVNLLSVKYATSSGFCQLSTLSSLSILVEYASIHCSYTV